MRRALAELEGLQANLTSIKHRISSVSNHEVETHDLNKALRCIDQQINLIASYIRMVEEKEKKEKK